MQDSFHPLSYQRHWHVDDRTGAHFAKRGFIKHLGCRGFTFLTEMSFWDTDNKGGSKLETGNPSQPYIVPAPGGGGIWREYTFNLNALIIYENRSYDPFAGIEMQVFDKNLPLTVNSKTKKITRTWSKEHRYLLLSVGQTHRLAEILRLLLVHLYYDIVNLIKEYVLSVDVFSEWLVKKRD